ncbi:hypothetical protein Bbelb_361370 [Branchiostoma belcheri]|nr:hypothetical protein Bbelb_361370 [Branchiostoma belcheri]
MGARRERQGRYGSAKRASRSLWEREESAKVAMGARRERQGRYGSAKRASRSLWEREESAKVAMGARRERQDDDLTALSPVLEIGQSAKVAMGRRNENAMRARLERHNFDDVIEAVHTFALRAPRTAMQH